MRNSLQRLWTLIVKETTQVLRDRGTLILMAGLPFIELFLFAYAVTLTVYHLPTAIVDQSQDERSRAFIQDLENSGYFDVKSVLQSDAQVIQAIDEGKVKAGVVIPPELAANIERGQANVLILLDGSDSFSVQSGYAAASAIAQKYGFDLTTEKLSRLSSQTGKTVGIGGAAPVTTSLRVLYNPDINDMIFILPGLISMLLQVVIVAHAALVMVREREAGTMEQLLATPIRPLELILAKMVPDVLVVMGVMVLILLLGVFWFGVPFMGSVWLFAWLAFLFVITGVGLGLLISTISRTQKQAQQISILLMVFSMMLTGFIYPRSSMPEWCQVIGNILPLTYFIRIARGIITKGVGISFLWTDVAALGIFAVLVLTLSAVLFRRRLD
jgi:ABC-2 type transport system permease protein